MTITRSLYATIATLLVAENAFAAIDFKATSDAGDLKGGTAADGLEGVQRIITQLLGLITLVAVAYVIWAGWQILSAGGDEEKVKAGRKTMINVLIGIVVMWLSYWIVTLVIEALV